MRSRTVSAFARTFGALALVLPLAYAAWDTPAQAGPYPPAAPYPGNVAISATSSSIVEWASGYTIDHGLQDITDPSSGTAYYGGTSGTPSNNAPLGMPPQPQSTAYGIALGQSGSITLTFNTPISDAPGYDFAVFGNGFGVSSTAEWIKPAFVEVSSDGVNFFPFPSVSLTPTATQVGDYGTLDPTNLYDLAGKDPAGWGTPFALSELAGTLGLNVNDIIAVRLVDCVGDIDAPYASYDSEGNVVNSPWPAPSPGNEGFVLAGVGVLSVAPEPGTAVLTIAGLIVLAIICTARRRRTLNGTQPIPTTLEKEPLIMLRHILPHSTATTTRVFLLGLMATALMLAAGSLSAQTPIGTIYNIPGPGNANSFGTSLRYSASGQLYAWDGQSVWTLSGTTFSVLGTAPANNSADPGPINFSNDGQTVYLSNGSGGGLAYSNPSLNGLMLTMPNSGSSATVGPGSVPYAFDFIPVPSESSITGAVHMLLVDQGNASYSAASVSVYDPTTGTNKQVITGVPGASTSIAFNPLTDSLYVEAGYGAGNQGMISSFPLSVIATAFNNNTPLDFTASGTPFNTNPGTGPTTGAGLFFDADGYLFSGGDGGITVYSPNGTLVDQLGTPGSDTEITYDPAADQVLAIDGYSDGLTGLLYQAADFEIAPEPGTLALATTFAIVGAIAFMRRKRFAAAR